MPDNGVGQWRGGDMRFAVNTGPLRNRVRCLGGGLIRPPNGYRLWDAARSNSAKLNRTLRI